MSQHVSEHGESHRRCRNARNGNHQFLYGQVQISLAHRSKDHTIIKPHGDGSEDALQHRENADAQAALTDSMG
jgi:hypothetical protein